ncbi:MAG: hypothetical protein WBX11_03735 [Thiobacillaceae bacterium]
MKTSHEGNPPEAPLDRAVIDIGLAEEGDANHVLISVDREWRMKLTFEEARFLVIRIITAANQAEVRCMLKGTKGEPPPATKAAPKAGWFLQAFAR